MKVLAVLLLLLVAGCGVPVQSGAVPIEPTVVPSQLRGSGHPASPRSSGVPGRTTLQVSFVRSDQLVSLRRQAPATDPLQAVVADLIAGPSAIEQANGVTTALPPNASLKVVELKGTRAVLELSGDTEGRSATENVLAVGQIVLSVTALPSVDEVTFSRNGVPVEALLADGALTTEPLTEADYQSLRAR